MSWPLTAPEGNASAGLFESARIEFLKLVYWKTNSLNIDDRSDAEWLARTE